MKLTNERPAETDMRLLLARQSYIYPLRIAEDILVEVAEHVYPIDFVILDIKEDEKRPFGTDITRIIRKEPKTGQKRTRDGKSTQEPGIYQAKHAANISTHTPEPSRHFISICYDDDDDEESTIPLNEIISQIPPSNAITPVLPTMEPEDSLSMGDEHLSTIPEQELDEFIKSSVEVLYSNPHVESEDTPRVFCECNDFSPINILEGKSMTFSNPLFDSNDNFTSSDDESLSMRDRSENIQSKESYVSNLMSALFRCSTKDECLPGRRN
ncbi:hypothetical protein Tco_0132514 [Tanacetum coccineum]